MNTTCYLQLTELSDHDLQRWLPKMNLHKHDWLKSIWCLMALVTASFVFVGTARFISANFSMSVLASDKTFWTLCKLFDFFSNLLFVSENSFVDFFNQHLYCQVCTARTTGEKHYIFFSKIQLNYFHLVNFLIIEVFPLCSCAVLLPASSDEILHSAR